jgi:hypothetical protein
VDGMEAESDGVCSAAIQINGIVFAPPGSVVSLHRASDRKARQEKYLDLILL